MEHFGATPTDCGCHCALSGTASDQGERGGPEHNRTDRAREREGGRERERESGGERVRERGGGRERRREGVGGGTDERRFTAEP